MYNFVKLAAVSGNVTKVVPAQMRETNRSNELTIYAYHNLALVELQLGFFFILNMINVALRSSRGLMVRESELLPGGSGRDCWWGG